MRVLPFSYLEQRGAVEPTPPAEIVTDGLVYFWDWAEPGTLVNDPGSINSYAWTYKFYDKVSNAFMYLRGFDLGDISTNWIDIPGTGLKSGWMRASTNGGVAFGTTDVTIETWMDIKTPQVTLNSLQQVIVLASGAIEPNQGVGFPNLYIGPQNGGDSQLKGRVIYVGSPLGDSLPYYDITNGQFYHTVCTWNNTTGFLKLYINGTYVATNSPAALNGYSWGSPDWHIGEDYNSDAFSSASDRRSVKSRVGNQRVYDRILTDAEVLQNYQAEQSLYIGQ